MAHFRSFGSVEFGGRTHVNQPFTRTPPQSRQIVLFDVFAFSQRLLLFSLPQRDCQQTGPLLP